MSLRAARGGTDARRVAAIPPSAIPERNPRSITEAERFADRVETDDAFATSLAAATDPAAAYQLVRDAGYDASAEEIRDVFLERHSDELTPEQLDAISGGSSRHPTTIEMVGIQTAMIGASAAAAW